MHYTNEMYAWNLRNEELVREVEIAHLARQLRSGRGQNVRSSVAAALCLLAVLALTTILMVQATRPAEAALSEAQAWGLNDFGELGNGTAGPNTSTNTPGGVSNLGGVRRMDGGCIHSLALKSNGTLRSWGDNEFGQLGAETTDFYSATPVRVRTAGGATFRNVKGISTGCLHDLALTKSGTVYAWGNNETGQLGNGTKGLGNPESRPARVSGLRNVRAVSAGSAHSLALKRNGTVWAWGDNLNGQLGDGTDDERLSPVQVKVSTFGVISPLRDVKAVAAGGYFSLALKEDGTVYAWGWNNHGQLGNGASGSDLESYTAQKVKNLKGVKAIVAGGDHALALKKNGTVYAWGNNVSGQLGDGTDEERTIPVQVEVSEFGVTFPLSGVRSIAAGKSHSLARMEDGTVRTWGFNDFGQLGDGTDGDNRLYPVEVSGLNGVTSIGAGNHHSLAVEQ